MKNSQIDTLATLPELHARNHPDSTALIYNDTFISYRELDRRSNQVANAFDSDGLARQNNIAFLDKNSDNFFYLLFGAAKAGVCMVTVNFRLTASEVSYIVEDSESEYLFVGPDFVDVALACQASTPRLKKVIVVGGEGDNSLEHWLAGQPDTPPTRRAPTATERAVQMYTSGTTGHPKGVMLSHRCMIVAAVEGLSMWPVMHEPGASVLCTMPLFHIAGANLSLACLYAGGQVVIMRETLPAEVVRQLVERKIRVVPLPPALIHEIVRLPDIHSHDLSYLDTLLISGSAITVELLREAQGVLKCGFALSYGMTECCGGVTYLGPRDCVPNAGKLLASAGKPFGSSAIRIVDPDRKDLPAGEIGEIACLSDRVMTGYWNRPEATAEAIEGDWYYSGDAGYMDERGYLYVVDRIKDMVISGGENIYPVEIENELIKHPAVADVAIIGIPDEKWGESLLASVILEPGASVSGKELESYLRNTLAGYKVPRRYVFVDTFPRNATGKVLKREMRAQWKAAGGK
ncbi:MAG: long-chain-fatty-acid--CoA ligase [Parahaliea sp.]